MNGTESKAGSLVVICPVNDMAWKQEYQVMKIGSNYSERPKPFCDDPDECAGDNGGKDKTQIAKQI